MIKIILSAVTAAVDQSHSSVLFPNLPSLRVYLKTKVTLCNDGEPHEKHYN